MLERGFALICSQYVQGFALTASGRVLQVCFEAHQCVVEPLAFAETCSVVSMAASTDIDTSTLLWSEGPRLNFSTRMYRHNPDLRANSLFHHNFLVSPDSLIRVETYTPTDVTAMGKRAAERW